MDPIELDQLVIGVASDDTYGADSLLLLVPNLDANNSLIKAQFIDK